MSSLDQLAQRHPLPSWRILAWLIMLLIASFLAWAYFAPLDEVATAPGEVVPRGNVKVIQHLEGGIIKAIHVEDGSRVQTGDLLVQLNVPKAGASRDELQVRLDNLFLVRARLMAEAAGNDLEQPEDVAERRPEQALAERRAFSARREQLNSSLTVLRRAVTQRELEVAELESKMRTLEARQKDLSSPTGSLIQQAKQKELEIKELEARRVAARDSLELARQRLEMSAKLLADNLVPRMEHLQLQAEVTDLQGEIQTLNQSIPRTRAAVAEVRGQIKEQVNAIQAELEGLNSQIPRARAAVEEARERVREEEIRFRREAQEQLGETEQSIARIREMLSEATEQTVRADIRSPIDGVIKNLKYNTLGGVVQPGEPIMEIVPTGEKLVISARLNPSDRGYVEVGQKAMVKVSTFDFARYGGLEGEVIMLAPDSNTDERGNAYFRVMVETEKTYLGKSEGELAILPGMQTTVDIHTGTRTWFQFLLKPIMTLRSEAFRER